MNTYIICGYGIPKDIHTDENYITYLHTIFNAMYRAAANDHALIIPCGGETNCTAPFDGNEAEMMHLYLQGLIRRNNLQEQTAAWQFLDESESLSTLENIINAKSIVDARKDAGPITIFCEYTREHRVKELTKRIFSHPVTVQSVDFDTSKQRYQDPVHIEKRESAELKTALWVLEREDRRQQYHAFFEHKMSFLREQQKRGMSHVDAIAAWHVEAERLMRTMPDHPLNK